MAKTILVVDDSESIREVVGYTLEQEGYRVIRGTNGKDALTRFNESEIDMVITDLYMPEMDGLEFIREIRKSDQNKHIPILFLTTESQLQKKEEARQAGATGWIVKPFVPDKLIVAVKRVLR
jgi:two-component system chemotaxis response regulator CheY